MLQVESSSLSDPLLASNGNHTSRSAHVVEEIRKRFFTEEWPENKGKNQLLSRREATLTSKFFLGADLYDDIDIERLRNSEWFVKRFLLASRRNANEAFEMLKITLAWRKSVQLSTTPINTFPREFFQIGGLFQYEPDLEGNPVIYMRIRMHRKIVELQEPIQQFLFYIINKVDLESNNKGAVILFDCSGAGWNNMDLDMLKVLTEVAFKYFPFCIKKVIVYELSWMLNAFRRIAMSIIPSTFAKIVFFATKNDITNYIALENLPDFIGGTCQKNYRAVPEGCPDVNSVAVERGFNLADVERIKGIFKPYLDEALAAIAAQEEEERVVIVEPDSNETATQLANELLVDEVQLSPGAEDTVLKEGEEVSDPVAIVRAAGKSFTEFASLYPQNVLTFRQTPISCGQWPRANAQYVLSATILLRNNHLSKPLAFKVQSTNAGQYSVSPNQGVILCGAFVSITLTAKSLKQAARLSQDKFMILLCPEVDLQTDLTNLQKFNRLFVEKTDKVFSHKVKAMLTEEKAGSKATLERAIVGKLEREVDRLKSKCGRLEVRQKWLNLVTLLIMSSALFLVAWPLFKGQHLPVLPYISTILEPAFRVQTSFLNESLGTNE